jgi:hypothetical protein
LRQRGDAAGNGYSSWRKDGDAVLPRSAAGFDILFDIALTTCILADIGAACHSIGRHG